jgi:hypothetical protein
MKSQGGSSADREANETVIPLLAGFFLFLIWFTTDFALGDKFLMTSLILGMEVSLAIGLAQKPFKTSREEGNG